MFIFLLLLEFGIPEFLPGLKVSIFKTFKYSNFEIFYPMKATEKKSSIFKYFYFRNYWSKQYLNKIYGKSRNVADKQTNKQTDKQLNKAQGEL